MLTKSFQENQATSTAEIDTLQIKLLQSEQQQQVLQTQLDNSSHSIQTLQLQTRRLQQDVATANAAESTAGNALHALQAQCSQLQQQVAQLQHGNASDLQQQSAAVLQLLEGQLVSLSGQVRQKDEQLAALQQTVQQQCDEHILMQIQLVQLKRAAKTNGSDHSLSTSGDLQQSTAVTSNPSMSAVSENGSTGSAGLKNGSQGDGSVQSRSNQARLNRIASASEQSVGKTGLLARILATDSTTGKACR